MERQLRIGCRSRGLTSPSGHLWMCVMTMRWVITMWMMGMLVCGASQPGDADHPTRNGNPRHEEKVKAVRSGTYDLALVGDSIFQTVGELNDGKYAPNQAVWKRHFEPRHAINLGMNGQRTEEILWNLENGQLDFVRSPKVFLLLIGTNNSDDRHFARTHTAEEIYAGTRAIVELIRRRHPTSRVLVLRIFPGVATRRSRSAHPPSTHRPDASRRAVARVNSLRSWRMENMCSGWT